MSLFHNARNVKNTLRAIAAFSRIIRLKIAG